MSNDKPITAQSRNTGLLYAIDPSQPNFCMAQVPVNDDTHVLLWMPREHYRVISAGHNNRVISNYRTCKNAKAGIYQNNTVNFTSYIVNNDQVQRIENHPETLHDLRVSNAEFETRVKAPSSRSKGKIEVVAPLNISLSVQNAGYIPLAQITPQIGAQIGTPIYYPTSESSETN